MRRNFDFYNLLHEIKDYFNNRLDEDYMKYNDHKFSSVECLMDPDCLAPWDPDREEQEKKETE